VTDSPGPDDQLAEPVGIILARWRKQKRMTGQALGERVRMSQAKISRLENGVVAVEPGDVRLLAEQLGRTPAEVEWVVALAERAGDRLTDWRSGYSSLSDRQDEAGRVETQAKEIRVLQPTVVPGLIQTSEYARAIFTGLKGSFRSENSDSPLAVSEAVNARMKRSEILLKPGHRFFFVITEQVLRNRVCDPAAMVSQIARLREVAAFPNVDLRIVTDDTDLPTPPYHGFNIADDRRVSVDLFNTIVESTWHETIRTYRQVFDDLESVARVEIGELLGDYQLRYARMIVEDSVAT
jgi:transcriptional regulator with XRE-family HTH domain